MKEEQIGSLEMLQSRISDIVELYITEKIDDMQFSALYHQEFEFAYCEREEDIKAAYVSGTGHDNWNSFHNKPKELNEAYKNAETYYKENFKNK